MQMPSIRDIMVRGRIRHDHCCDFGRRGVVRSRTAAAAVAIVTAMLLPGMVVMSSAATARDTVWMTGPELTKTFKGADLSGFYRNELTFDERFDESGRVAYRQADGTAMAGEWSVAADSFCTIYENNAGGCFRVTQVSANCYAFYSYASTPEQAREGGTIGEDWVAKGWLTSKTSTCTVGTPV